MQELFNDVRNYFNERLNSPLVISYVAAWLFFNYKVPLWLFSELSANEKIALVDAYLHSGWDSTLHAYGWPALISFVYVFILPVPAGLATAWTLLYQNVMAKLHQVILRRRVVTAEEVAQERAGWQKRHEEAERQIYELETRNSTLRTARERAENELTASLDMVGRVEGLEQQISQLEMEKKQLIAERTESSRVIDDLKRMNEKLQKELGDNAFESDEVSDAVEQFASTISSPAPTAEQFFKLRELSVNKTVPIWLRRVMDKRLAAMNRAHTSMVSPSLPVLTGLEGLGATPGSAKTSES